jgi:hypothetical protein
LTFDLFGLYQGAFVMNDRQTGTLWSHLTGEALAGPLVGHTLDTVPVTMASLGRWLELHPTSTSPDPLAMATPRPARPRRWDPSRPFVRSFMPAMDGRLAPDTLVLGATAGEASRAYIVDADAPGPSFYLDELGTLPIALLGEPGSWPLAYRRELQADGPSFSEPLVIVELRLGPGGPVDETGTSWSYDGRALEGVRSGLVLPFVPSFLTQWFAWAAYHPETDVVALSGAVSTPDCP